MRPGMASRLPPSAGAQNEWMTSAEVMDSCTGRPRGRCGSFAVTSASSGYRNSHHHWWPITSTFRASAGASPAVAKMVRTVGTATNTRMTAGASVHAISMTVWPWVGRGGGRPSRWRKRIRVTTRSVSTTRKTPAAHQKMSVKRWSIAQPKSDRGSSVLWGNGPPQPETASATVSRQSRYRGTASLAGRHFPRQGAPQLGSLRHDRRRAGASEGRIHRPEIASQHVLERDQLLLDLGREHLEHRARLRGRGRVDPSHDGAQPADPLDELGGEVQRILERPVADLVQLAFDRTEAAAQRPRERAQARRTRPRPYPRTPRRRDSARSRRTCSGPPCSPPAALPGDAAATAYPRP